jgi:hypothetical protein
MSPAVSQKGVRVDTEQPEAAKPWPPPRDQHELRDVNPWSCRHRPSTDPTHGRETDLLLVPGDTPLYDP